MRSVCLAVVLFIFWLLLSGHYTPLLLGLGVFSCILVVYIARRMDILDNESISLSLLLRFIAYSPWLLKEIWKSNLNVARIILTPSLPISPTMAGFQALQKTDLGRVIYANSITLTPGTITTDVNGCDLKIHGLTWEDVDGRQEEDEMNVRVSWVEGVN